jgi:hypothetical protein
VAALLFGSELVFVAELGGSGGVVGKAVGRTPWSARVPLDPFFAHQADEGVGRGPGGPPH